MKTIDEVVVDGHTVSYRVTKKEDGTFTVSILTRAKGNTDAPHEWTPSEAATFLDETAAVRYAHYVLTGISKVRSNGDPVPTVM